MSGESFGFELRTLAAGDEAAVLAFELVNRGYFARFISDRGDDFFDRFAAHHAAMIRRQDDGACVFHVLVDPGGDVVGRVNLYDLRLGEAVLGYRMAERIAGRGVATAAVSRVATLAWDAYGLRALTAVVTENHPASVRVLQKAGFFPVGGTRINAQAAIRFRRSLGG